MRIAGYIVAIWVSIVLTSIYWSLQLPDPGPAEYASCNPIYYSGLECCK